MVASFLRGWIEIYRRVHLGEGEPDDLLTPFLQGLEPNLGGGGALSTLVSAARPRTIGKRKQKIILRWKKKGHS